MKVNKEANERLLELWRSVRLHRKHTELVPPRKSRAKQAKLAAKLARKKRSRSMMDRGQPAGYRPVGGADDKRTKKLFAAHEKRKEAGWIRG